MRIAGLRRLLAPARLHERLNAGDPDLEPDKIQVAIDRGEQKRREPVDARPAAKQSAKMIALLPRAAEAYRRQIAQGITTLGRLQGARDPAEASGDHPPNPVVAGA